MSRFQPLRTVLGSGMPWGRALLLLLLVCLLGLGAAEDGRDAGFVQLGQLDRQIEVMTDLVGKARAALDQHQAAEVENLDLVLTTWVTTYQPYQGPVPQTWEENLAAYPALLKSHTGFDPLAPVDPWTRSWVQHRREEHRLNDAYQEVRMSLKRLQTLRARLRAQLGLPAEPAAP